jgi:hypothetical protein
LYAARSGRPCGVQERERHRAAGPLQQNEDHREPTQHRPHRHRQTRRQPREPHRREDGEGQQRDRREARGYAKAVEPRYERKQRPVNSAHWQPRTPDGGIGPHRQHDGGDGDRTVERRHRPKPTCVARRSSDQERSTRQCDRRDAGEDLALGPAGLVEVWQRTPDSDRRPQGFVPVQVGAEIGPEGRDFVFRPL